MAVNRPRILPISRHRRWGLDETLKLLQCASIGLAGVWATFLYFRHEASLKTLQVESARLQNAISSQAMVEKRLDIATKQATQKANIELAKINTSLADLALHGQRYELTSKKVEAEFARTKATQDRLLTKLLIDDKRLDTRAKDVEFRYLDAKEALDRRLQELTAKEKAHGLEFKTSNIYSKENEVTGYKVKELGGGYNLYLISLVWELTNTSEVNIDLTWTLFQLFVCETDEESLSTAPGAVALLNEAPPDPWMTPPSTKWNLLHEHGYYRPGPNWDGAGDFDYVNSRQNIKAYGVTGTLRPQVKMINNVSYYVKAKPSWIIGVSSSWGFGSAEEDKDLRGSARLLYLWEVEKPPPPGSALGGEGKATYR